MALRALQGPAGGSAPVGGSGTSSPSTIPRWTGPSTLGDSGITDNGSTVSFVGRNITAPSTAGGASYVLAPTSGQVFGQTVGAGVWYLGRTTAAGAAVQPDICVNASGNVGIGTASPRARTELAKAAAPTTTTVADSYLQLGRLESGASSYRLITFGGVGESEAPAYIGFIQTSTTASTLGDLVFGTRATTTNVSATERARIDSAGNLGLAVTPSPWNRPSLEIGVPGAGITRDVRDLILTANAYIDAGGWKYAANASAGRYDNAIGVHRWFSAASGTAGTAISFTQTMTLNASGQLAVGTTSFTTGRALTTVADLDVFGLTVGRGANGVSGNTAVGAAALGSVTSASATVGVGFEALNALSTGAGNTAVGYRAVRAVTTSNSNTGIGYLAVANMTGASNTGLGQQALQGAVGASGGSNVGIGLQAGLALTTGANNVLVGSTAGDSVTTGSSNIVIGSGADLAAAGDSNQFVLGDATNYVATNGGATTYYATAGASLGYMRVRLNGTYVKIEVFADV